MVELVDTGDSKSPALKSVPVQVRPSVPKASNAPARRNVDADCLKSGSLPRLKAVDKLVNGLGISWAPREGRRPAQIDLREIAKVPLTPMMPIISVINHKRVNEVWETWTGAGNKVREPGPGADNDSAEVSHASPRPSTSPSDCFGLAASGQLSTPSATPSPSSSVSHTLPRLSPSTLA